MRKIFGRIPPVGNPITIEASDEISEFPGSLKTFFLNSGTAALAAGLQIAQQHCNAKDPEVIIPAYCCPDLLSAILYNNMKPVLVDFIPDNPYMDLREIEKSLSENTVAVIAVNFLGIPERLKELKILLRGKQTLLLEDSAQWFPESNDAFRQHAGDLVIYSFGRGKPICLMDGGALLVRNKLLVTYKVIAISRTKQNPQWPYALKSIIYNLSISSSLYWIIELLPFLSIGKTKFKALKNITLMPYSVKKYLASNIRAYQARSCDTQCVERTFLYASNLKGIDLPNKCKTYVSQRLLRHPILLNSQSSKRILLELSKDQGLGISNFYPYCLPQIDGVPYLKFEEEKYKRAKDFASRLITLPTHIGTSEAHLNGISQCFLEELP